MYTRGQLYDWWTGESATTKLKQLPFGPTLFDGIAGRFDDGSMRAVSCVLAIVVLMRRNDADAITRPRNAAGASLSSRLPSSFHYSATFVRPRAGFDDGLLRMREIRT